jgi:uncharacterized membrane protein YraQ (UPF0718 family)
MKKLSNKILLLTVVFTLILSGVAGALVYHINDAANAVKAESESRIKSYFSEKDSRVKADLQHLTETEIQRLKDETDQYLQQQINQDYQNELNQKSAKIQQVTNQKIQEIKDYIDNLMKEKSQ